MVYYRKIFINKMEHFLITRNYFLRAPAAIPTDNRYLIPLMFSLLSIIFIFISPLTLIVADMEVSGYRPGLSNRE